ncbi:MAG: SBBP repeat-containing protein, partial [Chthoniobacterales bacterium]|nr:SBBP repeat-containing protein [Chthoniobacterales bacterium]
MPQPSKSTLTILAGLFLLNPAHSLAGPYPPAAGQQGSTAIHKDDPSIQSWATAWQNVSYGPNVQNPWKTPELALGKAIGNPFDVVVLGDRGSITLQFDGSIRDGPGFDFAVFENSFNDTFLELAYVEVSSDGSNFFRFPSRSLTPSPVPTYGAVDPTNIDGLAGKYRGGYGTPFDLATLPSHPNLDKQNIRFVRIVDVCGDGNDLDSTSAPIYDPHPTTGSGGFDLDAIAIMNGTPSPIWKFFRLPDQPTDVEYRSPQFAILPGGRFIFAQGRYLSPPYSRFRIQRAWNDASTDPTSVSTNFDPSFLTLRNETIALLGAGGWSASPLYEFNPSNIANTTFINRSSALQNYAGLWWKNPSPGGSQGWLIAGTNGTNNSHSVTFLSTDGSTQKLIINNISTYSSGIATDSAGNLYVATYELSEPSDLVYRFTANQIQTAISSSTPLTLSNGQFLHDFVSSSSLAVDPYGRIWAAGWKLDNSIEIYDPSINASTIISPAPSPLTNAANTTYQISTFVKDNKSYIAYLIRDAFDNSLQIYYGFAEVEKIFVPNPRSNWRSYHFGSNATNPALESSLWGDLADPDS